MLPSADSIVAFLNLGRRGWRRGEGQTVKASRKRVRARSGSPEAHASRPTTPV
jgi:hypothetical protein